MGATVALAARVNATTVARAASPARHPPSKAKTSGQRLPHPHPPGVFPQTPGFFSPCRRPSGPASPKNRDQRPGLWISLGRVLAQPGSYPHEHPLPKSCCTWAPRFVQPAAQTLQRRKPAPAFRKKRLSTERGRLYYYCYLYIELSKNNQNPHSGAPQASLHKGRRQCPGGLTAKKGEGVPRGDPIGRVRSGRAGAWRRGMQGVWLDRKS